MKVVPFVAQSVAEALVQIHEQLGPDAVVLSMRPVPGQGLARFWQKSKSVEVLAGIAEPGDRQSNVAPVAAVGTAHPRSPFSNSGLPDRRAPALFDGTNRPHVFVGPPGVGKTTLLCKWMAVTVLNQNRTARVWRLDGATANTAEFLNIYGEMLGVSVERFWTSNLAPADLSLIDLPGIQPADSEALRALKSQLESLPTPRIHLVLNAAYEASILAEQLDAFAALNPEDLSFSHLDEERRQGKLLDLLAGTNCCLRFLSTGQKIPGDFAMAGEPVESVA